MTINTFIPPYSVHDVAPWYKLSIAPQIVRQVESVVDPVAVVEALAAKAPREAPGGTQSWRVSKTPKKC